MVAEVSLVTCRCLAGCLAPPLPLAVAASKQLRSGEQAAVTRTGGSDGQRLSARWMPDEALFRPDVAQAVLQGADFAEPLSTAKLWSPVVAKLKVPTPRVN